MNCQAPHPSHHHHLHHHHLAHPHSNFVTSDRDHQNHFSQSLLNPVSSDHLTVTLTHCSPMARPVQLSPSSSPFYSSVSHETFYNKHFLTKQNSPSHLVNSTFTGSGDGYWESKGNQEDLSWHPPHYNLYPSEIWYESDQNNSTGNTRSSLVLSQTFSDTDSSELLPLEGGHFVDEKGKNLPETSEISARVTVQADTNVNVNATSLYSAISRAIEADEDARKRRRRERNKLAACKCRFKKRQHVEFLVNESERLETSNSSLKLTLNELQSELEQLAHLLSSHQCHLKRKNALNSSTVTSLPHERLGPESELFFSS